VNKKYRRVAMNKALTNQEIEKYGLKIAVDGSIVIPVTIENLYNRIIALAENFIGQIGMQLNYLIMKSITKRENKSKILTVCMISS